MNKAKRKNLAAIMLVSALTAGCGSGHGVKADDPANAVIAAVVRVTRQDLSDTLEIASELEPFQEIEVYAKVSGYVKKLYVDWGTHVKQGQMLAVLEIPELEQQLQEDEAAVHRSEQDLLRAQEELTRAESTYNVAHLSYTRLAEVQKSRPELVAQEEIDGAQGKDIQASAGASAARDGLSAAHQQMLSAKAGLEKDRAMFAYARMTAPFEGVVTEIYAYTGALLPAGTSSNKSSLALCRLSQNNLLRLVIPVPERAVPDIHDGETVAIEVSGMKKTFDGQIARSSGQIEAQTRTMHTEVQVPNAKYELVPGMYASAKIPLHSEKNVLSVPVQAVGSAGEWEGTVLLVNGENRLEKRTIKLGLRTATQFEVLSGLEQGDMVIFGEQGQYKVGQLVKPKMVQPGGTE
jgi:RND family efflux transporter MFP subunit